MKVLVVDDSKLFQSILLDSFEKASDITPVICQNASSALSILESESVDFFCLSRHLNDSDGLLLVKKIRATKKYKYTPIILFTSEEVADVYADALKSGVTEVFHKKELNQLILFIQRFTLQQQSLSGRVLYIEDTKSQRNMITSLFLAKGLEVDAFASAEDALQSFIKKDYDLVVTDIVLEGVMTGMALTNHIRRLDGEKGEVPILALTGFDDISRRIELFYLGVTDYVIKPVIEQELLARVRNLIHAKQYLSESLKQRKLAETADKAKSDFLSSMSHELRTPLNAILGFSQIIQMDSDELSEDNQENITEIINAGNHLLTLINEILDLATIESGKVKILMEDVDVSNSIAQCISLVTHQANDRGLTIVDKVSAQKYHIHGDIGRFKQVLLNLLSNAVKYNKDNGKIILDADVHDSKRLRISVTDTGEGLTEAQVNKLFISFERFVDNDSVQGTGIGLVITKDLVELMSGTIGVESNPGEGSTFWVELNIFTG